MAAGEAGTYNLSEQTCTVSNGTEKEGFGVETVTLEHNLSNFPICWNGENCNCKRCRHLNAMKKELEQLKRNTRLKEMVEEPDYDKGFQQGVRYLIDEVLGVTN